MYYYSDYKYIEGEHIGNIQQHSFHYVKRFFKMESWGRENKVTVE